MSSICIISDNHFFASGLQAVQPETSNVIVMSPESFLSNKIPLSNVSLFYIFVCERGKYLSVCEALNDVTGRIVFFINHQLEGGVAEGLFVNSKISLDDAECLTRRVLWRKMLLDPAQQLSTINLCRINNVAKGLPHYLAWIKNRTRTNKDIHNQNRELLKALGMKNVNIHNLFVSECIAVGMRTASVNAHSNIM